MPFFYLKFGPTISNLGGLGPSLLLTLEKIQKESRADPKLDHPTKKETRLLEKLII
jgi:hypothetical protein